MLSAAFIIAGWVFASVAVLSAFSGLTMALLFHDSSAETENRYGWLLCAGIVGILGFVSCMVVGESAKIILGV